MFSGNIFKGTFNIDDVKRSQTVNEKKNTFSKKALEDNMTPTVNKCGKLKSNL